MRPLGQALVLLALAGTAASVIATLLNADWDGAFRFAVVGALIPAARSARVPPSFLGAFAVLLLFATWGSRYRSMRPRRTA